MTIHFGPSCIPWLEQQLGDSFSGEVIGLGLERDGRWVAAVAYHERQSHNVNASIAALPGSLTKHYMKAIFDYPFNYLKVSRITSCVRPGNAASITWNKRVGFTYEGCQRKGYPDGEDKLIFGMLREECKWIS
jgi:RimJ/RimL family protein N-acetyltransferase